MGGAVTLSVAERLGVDKVAGLVGGSNAQPVSGDAARYLLWGLSDVVPTWEVIQFVNVGRQ
jgi:hypothetical protein